MAVVLGAWLRSLFVRCVRAHACVGVQKWIALRATLRPYLKATTSGDVRTDRVRMRFYFEKAYNPDLSTDIYHTTPAPPAAADAEGRGDDAGDASEKKTDSSAGKKASMQASATSASVAARVAGMAAKLAVRHRKLTRVYEWPPVRSELMRYYHVALGSFFAGRAGGQGVNESSLSVLTGTAMLPRKVVKPGRPVSRGNVATSRPGSPDAPGTGRSDRPTFHRRRKMLWAKLRACVQVRVVVGQCGGCNLARG